MPLIEDKKVMLRCFELAQKGAGKASPNPLVGAILIHRGRIIGEGYHERFGGPHAEVNALNSVAAADRSLIAESTLYVSLEPCCVYGKTPPCTNLIIEKGIRNVVVSSLDPSPEVNGRGIEILRNAGITVTTGILDSPGRRLIAPRKVFACQKRPYIILKWAETANGFMASAQNIPIAISNEFSRRLVHRWRMEADGILVGPGTAMTDNPRLDNRHFYGKSPLRIVLDPNGSLPAHLQIFDGSAPTLLVHEKQQIGIPRHHPSVMLLAADRLEELLGNLHARGLGILLVEGGKKTLEKFIAAGLWDEARIITSSAMYLPDGKPSPLLPVPPSGEISLGSDKIRYYYHQ